MKRIDFSWLLLLLGILALAHSPAPSPAEHHRATRLGLPATRFAPPLTTPEDLRARFRDEKLRPDIASIVHQWGWPGNLDDLHRAALSAEITEWTIPVGTTMPFMSSRENGKPICLRNVLWAGKEPISAYAFTFSSKGQRYRCITPRPCSNFFLEDLGPEPRHALALECQAPAEVLAGRPAEICVTARNTGNVAEQNVTITLPVAENVTVASVTEGGVFANGKVVWTIPTLAPNAAGKVCADLKLSEPGSLAVSPTASGAQAQLVTSACETRVNGIPAILIDAVDLEDPVEVGKEVIYDIKVTNQGTAPGTHVRLVCLLPASQEYVSGSGPTTVTAEGRRVTTEPLPALEPKAAATWRVIVKALQAEDARFKVELTSDQFESPIHEEESTNQY